MENSRKFITQNFLKAIFYFNSRPIVLGMLKVGYAGARDTLFHMKSITKIQSYISIPFSPPQNLVISCFEVYQKNQKVHMIMYATMHYAYQKVAYLLDDCNRVKRKCSSSTTE